MKSSSAPGSSPGAASNQAPADPGCSGNARWGQALIETALVMASLLLIMLVVLEFSYLWMISQTLQETSRLGARLVSGLPNLPNGDITPDEIIRSRVYDDRYEVLEVYNGQTGKGSTTADLDELFSRLPPLNRTLRPAMRFERWTDAGLNYTLLRMPGALFRKPETGPNAAKYGDIGRFRVLAADIVDDSCPERVTVDIMLKRVLEVASSTDAATVTVRFPYAFLSLQKYTQDWRTSEDALRAIEITSTGSEFQNVGDFPELGIGQYQERWEKGIWTIGGGDGDGFYLRPGSDDFYDTQRHSRLRSGSGAWYWDKDHKIWRRMNFRPARRVLESFAIFPKEVY